jgi:plasmid segregation protein ParM
MQNNTNLIKNTQIYSIHGLDIGNSTTKSNSAIIFDSKITTIEPLTKADKLNIDNKTYYLGHGNYDTTYRKIDKVHYIDMVYGLLALSSNTTHNYIALGLPLSQYKTDKERLTNMIMSDNSKIIEINDIEKTLIIDDCVVFPEGVSTVADEEECIVVDIGGLTIDAALVVQERGKRRIINPISIPTGTITLYTDFINKINNRYSLNLKMDDAERILRKGLKIKGKKVEIDFALEMYNEFTMTLISDLQRNYSLEINNISLTGGGAGIVYNKLRNIYEDSITIQSNAIFSNANNFYELACSYFE